MADAELKLEYILRVTHAKRNGLDVVELQAGLALPEERFIPVKGGVAFRATLIPDLVAALSEVA